MKIKRKLLDISACISCWRYDEEWQRCDTKYGKYIDDPSNIPDWCPLPDAKETSDRNDADALRDAMDDMRQHGDY